MGVLLFYTPTGAAEYHKILKKATSPQAEFLIPVLQHFDKWCQCFSFNQLSPFWPELGVQTLGFTCRGQE